MPKWKHEKMFCENDESIASKHNPSSDVISPGVHSESIFAFVEILFSGQNCVSFGGLASCLLLSQSA